MYPGLSDVFFMSSGQLDKKEKSDNLRELCHIEFTNTPQICLLNHKQKVFIKNVEVKLKQFGIPLETKMVTT